MFFRPTERFGSAHALAFVALVLAAGGGGYAVAQDEAPPQRTVAHYTTNSGTFSEPGGRTNFLDQLFVPKEGTYFVSAKLSIRTSRKLKGVQIFACRLDGIDKPDEAYLTLRRDEVGSVSLQATGSATSPNASDTQNITLTCESATKTSYKVKNIRTTAITLDGIGGG